MEKINIYDLEGKKKGLIDKPEIFSVKPRKDLIQVANNIMFLWKLGETDLQSIRKLLDAHFKAYKDGRDTKIKWKVSSFLG